MTALATAAALVYGAIATAIAPDPIVTVAEWAEQARHVAPETSRYPGKWSNARAPYLVEVMEALSLSDPCRDVVFKKSAQIGATEAGINLFGTIAARAPAPMLIVLPTGDMVYKYIRTKLEPAIEATPELKRRVFALKSRDETGSTGRFKKFPGGFAMVTGANSSADLQMVSVRAVILEEVSEYPPDVVQRGDPVDLAIARTKSYSEIRKIFYNSTPAIKGACRVSAKFEASDQRRYYVPCPHCGAYQILKFENLDWSSDAAPHGAYFGCAANGCVIEQHHRQRMVAEGVWLRTFPAAEGSEDRTPGEVVAAEDIAAFRARRSPGREPGFALWQAYSPFVPWDDTVAEWLAAQGDPLKEKVFVQQALGEAWEASGESPDWLKLHARREEWQTGIVPPGALFLTLGADVQKHRIEWAVWGWGIGKSSWLVDKGVIAGDTSELATFAPLAEIRRSEYPNALGRKFGIEAAAIDSGFNTQAVYAWVRALSDPYTLAIKGVPGAHKPALGTPSPQDVTIAGRKMPGGILLWPVGQWSLKSELYANLNKTIAGPGADGGFAPGYVHFPRDIDEAYLQQLTAEYLAPRRSGARIVHDWVKRADVANEALDIRIYAMAAAVHAGIDQMTAEDWARIAADRGASPEAAQAELALWQGGLADLAPAAPAAAPPPPPAPSEEGWLGQRGRDWFRS